MEVKVGVSKYLFKSKVARDVIRIQELHESIVAHHCFCDTDPGDQRLRMGLKLFG